MNGANTGGASVTLSGVNFGVSNLSPTAQVLGTVCHTTQWSSTTGLVCGSSEGRGVGMLLSVIVTAAQLVGTGTGLMTYDGLIFIVLFF